MAPERKTPGEITKKLNTLQWVVSGLFLKTANQPKLSPQERIKAAEEKLEEAANLLVLREQYPELEGAFTNLAASCERAEQRMENFKRVWKIE